MMLRAAALLIPALALGSQSGDGADFQLDQVNPRYDGRFTFTRVRYGGPGFRGRGASTWSHDYPAADRNMHRILDFLTSAEQRNRNVAIVGSGNLRNATIGKIVA